jgi:hypothetical protein
MSDTDTQESASQAWMRGDMQRAQELNQPIPDSPAVAPSGDVPAYLENHLAVQNLEQPTAPAQVSVAESALAKLSAMGGEHAEYVKRLGPDGKQAMENIFAAYKDITANKPELVDRVEASGLGNDLVLMDHLKEYWLYKSSFLGDNSMSERFTSSAAPAFRGNGSKASLQAELAQIRKDNPVGTEKYKQPAVQKRIMQINETLYGTGNIVGQGGRTG